MKVEHVTFAKVLTPRNEQTAVDPTSSYPIAGVYGFGRGLLLRNAIAGTETNYKALTRLHLDDLVYSKVKAFEGAFAVVGEDGEGRYVSPEFPVFRMNGKLHPAYVRHYVASEPFMHQITAMSSGIGARRERVSPAKFLTATIPLPSLPDQRRIATHLDSVNASQAQKSRLDERRTALRNAIIPSLFQRAPKRGTCSFGEVFELQRRDVDVDPGSTYVEVGVRSFGKGLFRKPTTGDDIGGKRVYEVRAGDLVVSNVFAWEGAIGLADKSYDGTLGSHRFMTWTPTADASADYAAAFLTTPAGIEALASASPGSAGRNRTLSIESLQHILIPRLSEHDEARVVDVSRQLHDLDSSSRLTKLKVEALLPAARNEVFSALR